MVVTVSREPDPEAAESDPGRDGPQPEEERLEEGASAQPSKGQDAKDGHGRQDSCHESLRSQRQEIAVGLNRKEGEDGHQTYVIGVV
jgi:hypothetical protein